ncbi:MBL fold metallo-hydrolase [Desulfofustis limnaeus]|uniref:MBL fold metallo-hydrolase n=1 Tax=Desulfofustis limnaeus TaxID=2740163 RepID=A0ABN6M1T0_9BACT|nr:MBL fold metallo-hydrolase [Desulfofustis limnaeus]MDX9896262.1 MBL fold metallo-hydrolase [Desulfofustis sp.]BDD86842.1 MBL fold metallo-hydrolase [Desulfofustis limnaeus]
MRIEQHIVGMMGVCAYILSCEKTRHAAIVDPGGDEERLLAAVERAGLTVVYIIATHGHPDHVCGNRRIKEATGAKIVMHEADDDFFNQPNIKNYFSMLGLEESPPADLRVSDGDLLAIGEESLRVIHTPGHTPGGMCLYSPPDLLTGDTLFVGGIGRTDFPGGSHAELIASIGKKLLVLPPQTTVWPGHGYGGSHSTIEDERRSNPYLR